MATGAKNLTLQQKVRAALDRFKANPESIGFRFRLNLSAIICTMLDRLGWSQKKLASQAGMKESFISRIVNAESNCTFDVAGRLLFALGLREGDIELVATRIARSDEIELTITPVFPRGLYDQTNAIIVGEGHQNVYFQVGTSEIESGGIAKNRRFSVASLV